MSHRPGMPPWSFPKFSRHVVIRDYPVTGVVPGWYLRVERIAAGIHRIHGTDLWGNTFSRFGPDEQSLIADVITAAAAWRAEAARRRRWIWAVLFAGVALATPFAVVGANVAAAVVWLSMCLAWIAVIGRDMAHRARRAAWLSGDDGRASKDARPSA